jgi:hypothetical protein
MRKVLALTLVMVLAMAGMASAAVTLGGSFKVEYVIDTDNEVDAAGTGRDSAALTMTLDAEDEGIWDLSVDLEIDDGDTFGVGDWTFDLNDELFAVELWGGGVEKDEVATPLGFIGTGDPSEATDIARMRLTSDLVGLADLTVDYEPNTLYLFASKALDNVTVGGAIKKDVTAEGMEAAGHVKYVAGPVTLTGEVGMDTAYDEDNLFLGGKVDYKFTDQLTVSGKVTREGENLVDPYGKLVIEPSVTYTEDLFKVTGKYTRTADVAEGAPGEATNKLTASVTYRSNDDVAYDDLFDDYDTLTGYAAFAEVAYTTAKDVDGDKEPATQLTLKGAGVAVPDMVWLFGQFKYFADKDQPKDGDFKRIDTEANTLVAADLEAENYMKLDAEATVKVTDKLSVVPSVAYGSWKEVVYDGADRETGTSLDMTAAVTYALTDDAEVGVSYTTRTQKFENADAELKDNFVKVYFSTSF